MPAAPLDQAGQVGREAGHATAAINPFAFEEGRFPALFSNRKTLHQLGIIRMHWQREQQCDGHSQRHIAYRRAAQRQ